MNILKALEGMTRRASLEREAAAIQRAADLEEKATALEGVVLDLIRSIHTAPPALYLGSSTLTQDQRADLFAGQTVRVDAPHTTWRPLIQAEERAMEALGFTTTQSRAQALTGGQR